jgi:hypothetical protein
MHEKEKETAISTNAGQGKMIVMSLNFSTVTRLKASAEWRFMF